VGTGTRGCFGGAQGGCVKWDSGALAMTRGGCSMLWVWLWGQGGGGGGGGGVGDFGRERSWGKWVVRSRWRCWEISV